MLFIRCINCEVQHVVSVGRCTVIKPGISERREPKHKDSHSKIVLWHIDTLVINNPYYLLRARSQLAWWHNKPQITDGAFFLHSLNCMYSLPKKLSLGPLVLMRNWHFLTDYLGALCEVDKTYSCFKGGQPFFQGPLYCSSWPTWWV